MEPNTYKLITRDEDVEWCVFVIGDFLPRPELPQCGTILDIAPIREGFELRYESTDLLLPIVQCRGRRYH